MLKSPNSPPHEEKKVFYFGGGGGGWGTATRRLVSVSWAPVAVVCEQLQLLHTAGTTDPLPQLLYGSLILTIFLTKNIIFLFHTRAQLLKAQLS